MALPIPRVRARALPLALAVALAGCGGVPKGPVLPGEPPPAAISEDAQARAVSLTRIADTALRSGDSDSAVGLFQEATLTDGRNLPAALGLGNALLVVGHGLEATKAFERALAIQPASPEARYGYARAMLSINRPEVAADNLRAMVATSPNDIPALNALGVAQDLLGDHQAAVTTYRQALAIVPGAESVRNNLALSLALQENYAEALDLLRRLAEGPGSTRRSRQNLALVYGLQGDMAAAERISRIDLGGEDLANNLAYFATVRGMDPAALRAAMLAPESDLVVEPRLTRKSKGARNPARAMEPPPASPVAPAAPASPVAPGAPRPLAPVLGGSDGPVPEAGAWFVDLGSFDANAANETWRRLRAEHDAALTGLERLAVADDTAQPVLVGPLATEQAAAALCGKLGLNAGACRPTKL